MNDLRQMTALGRAIEDDSFAIIDREAGPHDHDRAEWEVVRRIIHATADFEFKWTTRFGNDAVARGCAALRAGAPIIADVKMIVVGLNAARLASFGCTPHTFIDDEDVIARAKAGATTRAVESMREAHARGLIEGGVVVIGNAPTALLEIVRLHREEGVTPALVLGMPVGFVNAVESKEAIMETAIPYVVTRGRKGGSTITVAALHAFMHIATGDLR
ncbi:MAG: precorrin-8X methylmutase [Pseudomonadota bacterium]|nr:precorrin-8X methylmutase [Pseudomonadota bacterium]